MKIEDSIVFGVKSKIAKLISQFMQENELNQYQTAAKVGTTQPRISDLVRGKINHFSVESLLLIAIKIGISVEQSFEPEYGVTIQLGDLK